MKIKTIHLTNNKRFTDLTIKELPPTTRLVVLIGPNGCGKSSVFDALKAWYLYSSFQSGVNDNGYFNKITEGERQFIDAHKLINLEFHGINSEEAKRLDRSSFYFRSAYRHEPSLKLNSINTIGSPFENANLKMMIHSDQTIGENYQRLISQTLEKVFDKEYDAIKVSDLRNELVGKIRCSMSRLFGDLLFSSVGNPTMKAELYFDKGLSEQFGYAYLSAGEKAAFDLIFDLVVKQDYYPNTIFCIDEPETHIHTKLQADLLGELYSIINEDSQLWIATHSFGMLKKAKELEQINPGTVAFLNFDGYNFDEPATIVPSPIDKEVWRKILEITLDDYSSFVVPECIVLCEGNPLGNKRSDFDARCYETIFSSKYGSTMFFSVGSSNEVEKTIMVKFLNKISQDIKVIRLVDRDDRSDGEVADLLEDGVKVLSRRHIESYLLDEEILSKWCISVGKDSKVDLALGIRNDQMNAIIARGRPADDIKAAANDICTKIKTLINATGCGNNGNAIMRDTLAGLITEDTTVYQELESDIFG